MFEAVIMARTRHGGALQPGAAHPGKSGRLPPALHLDSRGKSVMCPKHSLALTIALACFFFPASSLNSKEPTQTAKNTLTLRTSEPIQTVSFAKPFKFHLQDVVDRTGNFPPHRVSDRDGGVFLSPAPREIVLQSVRDSLKAAGLLAADAASADYFLTVQLLYFGHVQGIGREYFFKVDVSVLVENAPTRESRKISSLGTSMSFGKKAVQVNMENALIKALRGFLRGTPWVDAVKELEHSAEARRAAEAAAAEAARRAATESASRPAKPSANQAPAAPEPPPEEAGVVLVSSSLEGAEVYVDGGFVGNTPARVKLSPGKYTFRVVMAGEEDWIRELSLMPGSELKVFARHTPKAPPPKPSAPAPDPKALSKEDILNLLTNFVPSARVAALVEQHGIKFRPTAADFDDIANAGGGSDLLDALRKASPADR